MSWDVVIALNRNLDQVEDMISHTVPLDIYQSPLGWSHGLGISRMEDSGVDIGSTNETTPPASNAPKDLEVSPLGNVDSFGGTALLGRVMNVVQQLRCRQQEFKVCVERSAHKISFQLPY